jgi:hypothetical protein
LPKELARFTWHDGDVAIASLTGEPLAHVQWQTHGASLTLPAPPAPVLTVRGPRRQFFAVRGWLRGVRRARVTVDIPPTSPFAPLRAMPHGPHLAFFVERFQLHIGTAFDVL